MDTAVHHALGPVLVRKEPWEAAGRDIGGPTTIPGTNSPSVGCAVGQTAVGGNSTMPTGPFARSVNTTGTSESGQDGQGSSMCPAKAMGREIRGTLWLQESEKRNNSVDEGSRKFRQDAGKTATGTKSWVQGDSFAAFQ